jgi:hypothetical protein
MARTPASPSRRSLFGTGVALALARTMPAAAAPHPDAELMRLGVDLDAARAVEDAFFAVYRHNTDEENEAATEPCSILVDQIEDIAATTLDGLMVKVRALMWCRVGEPMDLDDFCDGYPLGPSTDVRLVVSIIADLTRMGAA